MTLKIDNYTVNNIGYEDRPRPSISVVIPMYNRAHTIRNCIDSILCQTFPVFEILIVDDRSDDNSVETVKSYSDSRIRCIELGKHGGAQAARNRGILEASGDWIAFLDSDDEWMLEKLEKQVRILESVGFDPMTVVHTDCWRYDPASGERTLWNLPLIDGSDVYPRLLASPGPLFPTMLTSKAALESIGLLDEKVPSYQEWDTAIRLAKVCRFVHLREPLFTYHLHKGVTISKSRQRDVDGYQYIVDKFRDDIITFCGKDIYNSNLANNAIKAAQWGFRKTALDILQRGQGLGIKLLSLLVQKGAGERSISIVFNALKRLHLP